MTLDEAIKIKEKSLARDCHLMSQEEILADRLGIEALKRQREGGRLTLTQMLKPLPGETEE